MISVQGAVAPHVRKQAFRIDAEGAPFALPGVGGITYSVRVGDPAFGWASDHIEPGVSTAAKFEKRADDLNRAYNILSCIGNEARVVSGDAKELGGVVTGITVGSNTFLSILTMTLWKSSASKTRYSSAHTVRASVAGLPDVKLFNLDPGLLELMNPEEADGRLRVKVAAVVPAVLMGSGIGSSDVASGDYDITTTDRRDSAPRPGQAAVRRHRGSG